MSTVTILARAGAAPKLELPFYVCRVAAGFPSPAEDYIECPLDLNSYLVRRPASTFFVRVSGESMRGAGIGPGDILVVDRAPAPADGDIVIAAVGGELTVKRLYKRHGRVALCPENTEYPVLEINDSETLEVWGVVQYVIHRPR